MTVAADLLGRARAVTSTASRATLAQAASPLRPVVRWGLEHALPRTTMRLAAGSGDLQGRLVSEGHAARSPVISRLAEEIRASGPLHRTRFGHLTASHDVVKQVLSGADFHNGFAAPPGGVLDRLGGWSRDPGHPGPIDPPSLLMSNPPDHTRYRRLVSRVFTARAVAQLGERVQVLADRLLDDLQAELEATRPSVAGTAGPPVDLVPRYCRLLPITIISEILGVPDRDRRRILELSDAFAPSLDVGLTWRRFREVERARVEFQDWLAAHLAVLRTAPGENLLSRLVQVRDEEGGLTEAELRSIAELLLVAGFETTVNLLGNGVVLLLEHPEELARLRVEPGLWPNAVDEVLRMDPPVLLTFRTCARDTELDGVPVSAGSMVTTLLAGANRDPAVFADPDRFDVGRPEASEHVSFSAGRHFCLGAALARLEGEVGLRTLFERFPGLDLAGEPQRRPTMVLPGWEPLLVRLGAG